MSVRRAGSACISSTTPAAMWSTSEPVQGASPAWAERPRITSSNESAEARAYSGSTARTPAGAAGKPCRPKIASTP